MTSERRVLGVIGGSGVYAIDDIDNAERVEAKTPWGAPSAPLIRGRLDDLDVVFLARHGEGHRLPPGEVNYRANIDALKRAGVTDIVSFSACGSFREALAPGAFVIIDQYIDRTTNREKSFFGPGFVAHVSMAHPTCPALSMALAAACERLDIGHRNGGVYLCIDGPQFSTLAESKLYRAWGADIIGMTNMPEAKLAREAELPYASIGMVTDFDCWRDREDAVEVADILEVMAANTAKARALLKELPAILGSRRTPSPSNIETVLDNAVITPPGARDQQMIRKLDAVAGRFLKRHA